MIITGSFSDVKKAADIGFEPISVAIYQPKGQHMAECEYLKPTRAMLNRGYSYDEYVNLLNMRSVTAEKILKELDGKMLVCWEKKKEISKYDGCHRRFVARFVFEKTNVVINEIGANF